METLVILFSVSLLFFQAASTPLGARRDLIEPAPGAAAVKAAPGAVKEAPGAAAAAPGKPGASAAAPGAGNVFDVTTLGAVPDGTTDNTAAIIKAWNAACKSPGPAKLLFPAGDYLAGEIVFQGPCTAPITVEIVGNIIASSDLSDFTQGVWISVEHVDGVTVTGTGTLDGKGTEAWKFAPENNGKDGGGGGGDNDVLLPISLQFSHVKTGVMENFKVLNSKGFHTKVTYCTNITVTGLTITAPGDSPNTDGLHISTSTDVNVTHLIVATGDDCISIGEGNTNVNLLNITCGPGHGISIGSLGKYPDEKDVKGVTVRNCRLKDTTNGLRIKTYHASPVLSASGIIFEDIELTNVKNPIIIDQHYSSKQINDPSRVQISDVHFKNIRGTSISEVAVTLNCSTAVPCQGLEFADINLTPAAGVAALTSVCSSAKPTMAGASVIKLDTCGPPAA